MSASRLGLRRLDSDRFDSASVVDEDVEPPVSLDGRVNDALCLSSLGNIAAYSDSLATSFGNGGDNGFRPCLARSVVDDHYAQQPSTLGIGWSRIRIPHSGRLFPVHEFEYR